MINKIKNDSNIKMQICIKNFQEQINTIRTGRASPELLHNIYIDYFGSKVSLKNLATVVVEDYHTLKVNVFDDSNIAAIKKSILNSNLNLNPIINGKSIIVPIPRLNEDRRKELIKIVRSHTENARIGIRNIRRNANDAVKKNVKNNIISKDHEYNFQNAIQIMTNKFIKEIDIISEKKECELMQF